MLRCPCINAKMLILKDVKLLNTPSAKRLYTFERWVQSTLPGWNVAMAPGFFSMGNASLKYCLRVMCSHNGLSKGNASSQKNVASGNVDNASSQGNKAPGSAASQCVVNRQCASTACGVRKCVVTMIVRGYTAPSKGYRAIRCCQKCVVRGVMCCQRGNASSGNVLSQSVVRG